MKHTWRLLLKCKGSVRIGSKKLDLKKGIDSKLWIIIIKDVLNYELWGPETWNL